MGQRQREWLLGLLARWREWRLIVLVSSKPWLGVGGDSWASYADERLVISNFVASAGVKNLVMVAGDAHMLAIDDGSNTDFSSVSGAGNGNVSSRGGFPLLQAAPLTGYGSGKSGPYSHGCWAYQLFVNHQVSRALPIPTRPPSFCGVWTRQRADGALTWTRCRGSDYPTRSRDVCAVRHPRYRRRRRRQSVRESAGQDLFRLGSWMIYVCRCDTIRTPAGIGAQMPCVCACVCVCVCVCVHHHHPLSASLMGCRANTLT